MRKVVIGVDGGGTKTAAVLLVVPEGAGALSGVMSATPQQQQQFVVSRAVTGSTNWNSVGDDAARRNLFDAMAEVLRAEPSLLRGGAADVTDIVLGMACVDTPADKEKLKRWLTEFIAGACVDNGDGTRVSQPARLAVHSDAVIALASGTGGVLDGIVLIAGTGVICYGRRAQSKIEARAAGWGPALGDAGSGHSIGSAVLRAVMRSYDGRDVAVDEASDRLSSLALAQLKLATPEELLAWAYDGDAASDWSPVAALAPVCFAAERAGDVRAADILDAAADELASCVRAVARRLHRPAPVSSSSPTSTTDGGATSISGGDRSVVVLSGGIATHEDMSSRLWARLNREFIVRDAEVAPEVAAALLAVCPNDLESVVLL